MKSKIWLAIIAIAVFAADQLTKLLATQKLHSHDGVFLIKTNPFDLSLYYSLNSNLSFSIPAPRFIIIAISILLIMGLTYWLHQKIELKDNVFSITLVILISAALSNLADRIVSGAVVDFVSVRIFDLQWGIFNLADILITLSVLTLIYLELKHDNKERKTT